MGLEEAIAYLADEHNLHLVRCKLLKPDVEGIDPDDEEASGDEELTDSLPPESFEFGWAFATSSQRRHHDPSKVQIQGTTVGDACIFQLERIDARVRKQMEEASEALANAEGSLRRAEKHLAALAE